MSILIGRLAAESEAAEAALDAITDELAALHVALDLAGPAADREGAARLRRRCAELTEQLSAAQILAKECHIAELEAELAGPRGDRDRAVPDGTRGAAAHGAATGRREGPRERPLGAGSRLRRLRRERIEHSHALAALLAELRTGPPELRG